MKERDRILELVKQGVITTEEALLLLENMAKEKDEKIVTQEASKVHQTSKETKSQSVNNKSSQSSSDADKSDEVEDKERLEKILESLVAEANQTSAELDKLNVDIKNLESSIEDKQEQIQLIDTLEELEEKDLTEEKNVERQILKDEVELLISKLKEYKQEKSELELKLKSIHKERRGETWDNWSSKFEIPSDWKDTATDTMNTVGEKVSEAGTQLGGFLKKAMHTVADTVNENVDWKDVNIKVPGVAVTKFEHEFYYPEIKATLLNIKLANGKVNIKTWEKEDVKIVANIKLYGRMDANTPFEAFLERSDIDIDDECISFQVPNKRIKVEADFYLPKRVYDHISIKLLNGNCNLVDLDTKDIYLKNTNGQINVVKLNATMLEVEGVNGDISIMDGSIIDCLIESVNSDVTLRSDIENSNVQIVNGSIKLTAENDNLNKINASIINGTVKLALPTTVGLEGDLRTNLGSIQSRLSDYEIVREKKEKTNRMMQVRRLNYDQTAHLKVRTTTGSILLKDSKVD